MKKLTVTIAIPVFNEDQNLGSLLDSVLKQKTKGFDVEKIIVLNDGSTDKSVEIVKMFTKKDKRVILFNSKSRLGKNSQLQKLYKKCENDLVVLFDGDVLPQNDRVVIELVKKFNNPKIGIVGGINQPFTARNRIERTIKNWVEIWIDIRSSYNNGINVHNSLGCILAVRKEVYKNIKFPKNVTDDDFTYFTAINSGYKFNFAKRAVVNYRLPTNFRDFFAQDTRIISAKKEIIKHFGDWVASHYNVPLNVKLQSLVKKMRKSPFLTLCSILFQLIVRISIPFLRKDKSGKWKIAESTKNKTGAADLKKTMGLLNLAQAHLKGNRNIRKNGEMPKFIREFELVKKISKIGSKFDFQLALYKTPQGQKVFVKLFRGAKNEYKYNTFINEVNAYKILNEVYRRNFKNIPNDLKSVRIPKYIDFIETFDYSALVIEYIPGKMASEASNEVKIDSYLKASELISYLGSKLNRREREIFAARKTYHYLLLYPLLLTIALVNFPNYAFELLKGIRIFYAGIFSLLKNKELVLSHRDLHFNNILINSSEIILIDLQFIVFCNKLIEYVTTLRYRWGIDGMEKFFLPKIENQIANNSDNLKIFNGMMVNSITHGLIDKSYRGDRAKRWFNLLKIANSNPTILKYK